VYIARIIHFVAGVDGLLKLVIFYKPLVIVVEIVFSSQLVYSVEVTAHIYKLRTPFFKPVKYGFVNSLLISREACLQLHYLPHHRSYLEHLCLIRLQTKAG